MTKHIHATVDRKNGRSTYDVDIFQCAYDEICICLTNTIYFDCYSVQFDIPVKKAAGYSIKVNTASISNDTGSAADLIEFLDSWIGESYISGIVNKLIFEHPKKRLTPGL